MQEYTLVTAPTSRLDVVAVIRDGADADDGVGAHTDAHADTGADAYRHLSMWLILLPPADCSS
jgi:hypothetical protein